YVYTRENGTPVAQTPVDAVVVKDGDRTLALDADYEITGWEDNTDAGVATVTIALKNNYAGSGEANFTIEQKEISDVVWHIGTVPEYDGVVKNPELTNDDLLVVDEDYAVD
ncbi:hypothetical protein, partial [Treponema sp. R6D11]